MNSITRKQLDRAIAEIEANSEIELREDYSGRGMYGAECFGVVGDPLILAEFEAQLAISVSRDQCAEEDLRDFDSIAEVIMDNLSNITDERREDSMGRYDSIYYYPRLEVIEE